MACRKRKRPTPHTSRCAGRDENYYSCRAKNLSVHSGKSSYLRYFLFTYIFQYLHLLDSYPVQSDKPFVLRKSFSYEYGIQILHVREANQFVHRGIVADVSFQVGMRIAPFEGVRPNMATFSTGNLFSTVLAWHSSPVARVPAP